MDNNVINISLTTNQLRGINTTVSKLKIDKENKAVMVNGFSGGCCTSSKDLYFNEAKAHVSHLQGLQGSQLNEPGTKQMIGKMLSYAREMGWHKKNHEAKTIADMKRLNDWAVRFVYLNEKVNEYHYSKLAKLVRLFEIM